MVNKKLQNLKTPEQPTQPSKAKVRQTRNMFCLDLFYRCGRNQNPDVIQGHCQQTSLCPQQFSSLFKFDNFVQEMDNQMLSYAPYTVTIEI